MTSSPRVRELSRTQRDIAARHRVLSLGELCDFCRAVTPRWYWVLRPAAVVTQLGRDDAVVITPEKVFACVACKAPAAAGEWGLLRLRHEPDAVREAVWAAFAGRRVAGPYVCG